MRKNASVTFMDTTKLGGTAMGMGGMGGGGGNNAATSVGLTLHAESHGECNMEDDNHPDDGHFEADGGNEDNNANANASGATALSSFPIYLADVEVDDANQQRHGRLLSVSSSNLSPGPSANLTLYHSTSINALQYYYQNSAIRGSGPDRAGNQLLLATGMPVAVRPSINGLNLTFPDMLDVGDGIEGDLNSRSRNQRWKEFGGNDGGASKYDNNGGEGG